MASDKHDRIANWIDSINNASSPSLPNAVQQVLLDARNDDLILLENPNENILRPYDTPRPIPYRLIVVVKIIAPASQNDLPTALVRDIHRYDRRDFIEFQNDPAYFTKHGVDGELHFLTDYLLPETKVHLRPEERLLRGTFYSGPCAYMPCNEGIITLSRSIARELGIQPGVRVLQGSWKSICPFCMGRELFEEQESLALFEITDPGSDEASKDHLLCLNWRRMQLGYKPLGIDMMPHLTVPTAERLEKRSEASNTHTRPVNWFTGHLELELGPICPLCKEVFGETRRVTMLHCGHIFHRRCIKSCIGPKAKGCPFNCDGEVRLA